MSKKLELQRRSDMNFFAIIIDRSSFSYTFQLYPDKDITHTHTHTQIVVWTIFVIM